MKCNVFEKKNIKNENLLSDESVVFLLVNFGFKNMEVWFPQKPSVQQYPI